MLKRKRLASFILCLVLSFGMLLPMKMVVQAYNTSASHSVNQDIDIEAAKQKEWDFIRSMGYTAEATAGIMGNIGQECSWNYTRTQGSVPWSSFRKGKTGLGLTQWTWHTRQDGLFDMADQRGTQWTDFDTQLAFMQFEMESKGWWAIGNNYSSLDDFKKNCTDIKQACIIFEAGYENAGTPVMDTRIAYAYDCYNAYSGRTVDASISSGQGAEDFGVSGSASKKYSKLVTEWGLKGMPQKSTLTDCTDMVYLLGEDSLNTGEKYNMIQTKERILERNSFKIWDSIRIGVTFLGLCVILYTVMLGVAYLFDSSNNFIEIQLVSILTLGCLKYTTEDYAPKGYLTKSRLIRVEVISLIVGFLIVSGSVLNVIGDIVIRIQSSI